MAAEIARRYAALPMHAVASAKAYIIAAATSDDGGYAEEMARTRELLQTEATRTPIEAFLDRMKSGGGRILTCPFAANATGSSQSGSGKYFIAS
jgi:hypothetical protein